MNWCKTCKKELPMEASCNVAPECSNCRANRLERELEAAQAKLLASEAGGAEMREKYQDLRYFVRAVCLLLQRHRGATKQEMDRMFQTSYQLYTKHDVEHPLSIPCGTAFLDERDRHVKALEEIAGYGKDGICPYGCDCPNIARTALKPK